MPSTLENNGPSCLYLGLAGETGHGRVVHSGLFRLADGSNEWETLQHGLPEMPAIRALAVLGDASGWASGRRPHHREGPPSVAAFTCTWA
jgi:hypothetical protein